MAAGWSVLDALNKNSRAEVEDRPQARFRTRDIRVDKLYGNEKNFYSMQDIEELSRLILTVGLMQNIVVTHDPCEKGEYRIIAGERRWRALKLLIENGNKNFETVTCQILTPAEEHEEIVQVIIANAYRIKTPKDMLEEEKRLKESLQYMREHGLTLQGHKLDEGRLRDAIAKIMNTTPTKIAQIEGINNRLIPELKNELEEGRLTFSAAYELSGMTKEDQKRMLEMHDGIAPTLKEIKEEKQKTAENQQEEKRTGSQGDSDEGENTDEEAEGQSAQEAEEPEEPKGEEWEQAHPEGITSICYSCKRYTGCNVKSSTCTKCDQYANKKESEKTEEQKYDEEQEEIDRETRRKLREMDQEEKMQNLPSDSGKQKCIRVSPTEYEKIAAGKPYIILKKDEFTEGKTIKAIEFSEGRATGNELELKIICMDDEETSSALLEGYCVIGIRAAKSADTINNN